MPRHLVAFALVASLAACGTPAVTIADGEVVQAVEDPDYTRHVRPILEARQALGAGADYSWQGVLGAGPSGFVVPFDAEGSLMLRLVRDLGPEAAMPFPDLRRLSAAELALVARWIENGAKDGGAVAFADAQQLLLAGVQGENHVAVIDAETLRLVRRIRFDDHGLPSAPYGPHHFAFEPDGSAAYVSLVSAGVVAKVSLDLALDPSSDAALLAHTTPGAFATPGMLYTDGDDTLYIGRSTLSDPLATGLGVLDLGRFEADPDGAVETIATPFNVPHALAVTPDGRYVLTAELTGTQAGSRAAVYDTQTGDIALTDIPADGTPHELIHFSILGAHHAGMMPAHTGMMPAHGGMDHSGMEHGEMNHDGMEHEGMDHSEHGGMEPGGMPHPGMGDDHDAMAGMTGGYPYTVTLTSRSTDRVLFLTLAEDGELILGASAPAGDGPYHAHANHDGTALLIPDQFGDSVTLLDPVTRAVRLSVDAAAPGGPLSQPHSPAPALDGSRFFVTSSNLDGAWSPEYRFLGPAGADGARAPLPAEAFGNVAAFSVDGALLGVVQLGAYPSGLEPVFRSTRPGPMNHDAMGHGGASNGDG